MSKAVESEPSEVIDLALGRRRASVCLGATC
jgi:hypothetical protein